MDELEAVAQLELQPGWDVYDADGNHIGTVEDVGTSSFVVLSSGPISRTFGVAFNDIESADDGRVELAMSGEEIIDREDGPAY